jgi:hypothetical protein
MSVIGMIGRKVKFSLNGYAIRDIRAELMTGVIQDKIRTSHKERMGTGAGGFREDYNVVDKYVIVGDDNEIYLQEPNEFKLIIEQNE